MNIKLFGSSHDKCIGAEIDGLPIGFSVDFLKLEAFLARRRASGGLTTARKEPDKPEFLEGLEDGKITGKIKVIIENKDVKRNDYDKLKYIPRPSHADFSAYKKFGLEFDMSGGGPFSGRMTAPYCVAGGIALQILEKQGIFVSAKLKSVHGSENITEEIENAKALGDSVGGIIECEITGVPSGFGDLYDNSLESLISKEVFSIGGVKGIEFGSGFFGASLFGSENNDEFYIDDGSVKTKTNNHGGILGGLASGMPIVFRVAVKPTPSIAKAQRSVNLKTMEETELKISGRHDACIALRAVPIVEAAAAIAILKAGDFA